jgi:hypothetical protein
MSLDPPGGQGQMRVISFSGKAAEAGARFEKKKLPIIKILRAITEIFLLHTRMFNLLCGARPLFHSPTTSTIPAGISTTDSAGEKVDGESGSMIQCIVFTVF